MDTIFLLTKDDFNNYVIHHKDEIKSLPNDVQLTILWHYYDINQPDFDPNQVIIKSDKIVLDIETDGHNHILQIAYNMYNSDNTLIYKKNIYVYDGIHYKPFYPVISEEDIINKGISLKDASKIVSTDINNTNILIGHNMIGFDYLRIKELIKPYDILKDTIIIHDTMIESKFIVNALNKLGKIKYPKLSELTQFLLNKQFDNQHDATSDIDATFECYKILCDKYHCFFNKN